MDLFTVKGSFTFEPEGQTPTPSGFWVGIRNDQPLNMPAVIPAQEKTANGWRKYDLKVEFTKALQELTWAVWRKHNLLVTTKNWRGVMDANTWGTNFNGWHDDDNPLKVKKRADWITPQDTNYPNPYLMNAIVMAGTPLSFEERGEYLYARPGIDGIDVSKPLPSVNEVYERKWYFKLVNNGSNGYFDFAQGHGLPIFMPYFLPPEGATYNKAYFKKV